MWLHVELFLVLWLHLVVRKQRWWETDGAAADPRVVDMCCLGICVLVWVESLMCVRRIESALVVMDGENLTVMLV